MSTSPCFSGQSLQWHFGSVTVPGQTLMTCFYGDLGPLCPVVVLGSCGCFTGSSGSPISPFQDPGI